MTDYTLTDEQIEANQTERDATVAPEVADTAEVTEETPAEAKPAKEPKPKPEPHACTCSRFLIGQEDDGAIVGEETTGCTATTAREFAQGHDAKLVSFLVKGQADDLGIWERVNGSLTRHASVSEALSGISAALQKKGEAAVSRAEDKVAARRTREATRAAAREAKAAEKAAKKEATDKAKAEAKALKEAAKTGPKVVAATVVEGSQEGDVPGTGVEPGTGVVEEHPEQVKIKVGRWEYDAVIGDDGSANYLDGDGKEQTREAGTFRVLQNA